MNKKALFIFLLNLFFVAEINSQTSDRTQFDYDKIYAFCLDANVTPVFNLLQNNNGGISEKDQTFKTEFENRFRYSSDSSSYLTSKGSEIGDLLVVFRDYWRKALLDNTKNYDAEFISNYRLFIKKNFPELPEEQLKNEALEQSFKSYIKRKNLFSTDGIGKTGKLYDLLVWKSQKDTLYQFKIKNDLLKVKVVFMDDFITLGWEEYATLGRYSPSGWATKEALYCVRKKYDLHSEKFLVSYLAHEARHFEDYKIFPQLAPQDLEYRAKLAELCLADKTMYTLIDFFIDNSNYDSENAHQIANFCLIRDLSRKLFKVDYEKGKNKWHKVDKAHINKIAYQLLKQNTAALKKKGSNVKKYIKE